MLIQLCLSIGAIPLILFLIHYVLKYRRLNNWLDNNLKGRKSPSFLFGDMKLVLGPYFQGKATIATSNLNAINTLVEECRDQKIIRMFSNYFMPWIIITDCNYAKTFMNEQYTDRTFFTWFLEDFLGNGLLTISGPAWIPRRKTVAHTFHAKFYNHFLPVMNDYSQDLVQQLSETIDLSDGVLDNIDKYMSELSINVLLETIMGIDARSERLLCKKYAEAAELCAPAAYERAYKPWLWLNCVYFLTEKGRKVKELIDFGHQFANQVIEKRLKLLNFDKTVNGQVGDRVEISEKKRKPFLDNLLEQRHLNPGSLTEQDIRDEVTTFLSAGHHTTSIALTFSVYLLGLHPDVQIKVLDEVQDAFDGEVLNLDRLNGLKYLEAVIKEALRLYPPVPQVGRVTSSEIKIGPYVIPKGISVVIPIMAIQRDPSYFSEPEAFRPERFLNTGTEEKLPLIAFSWGPRICIGHKFAMVELKIVLAYLCKNFSFVSLTSREEIRLGTSVTLNFSPIRIKLVKRA